MKRLLQILSIITCLCLAFVILMFINPVVVGYDDGIFRKSRGRLVSINNRKYRLIGDVGMGMCAVKIDSAVRMYDKVTLIGDEISVKQVAQHNGTSIYETICNIGKQIPRVYIKDNEVCAIEEGK